MIILLNKRGHWVASYEDWNDFLSAKATGQLPIGEWRAYGPDGVAVDRS